jgi:hypothetical protein
VFDVPPVLSPPPPPEEFAPGLSLFLEDGDGEPEYETVYDSINYQDLTSDYFIRKSEVCGVQKVIATGEYFVELNIMFSYTLS